MPKIEAKIKEITAMVSVLIAVALVFFGYFTLGVGSIGDLLFFSVLIAIAPLRFWTMLILNGERALMGICRIFLVIFHEET